MPALMFADNGEMRIAITKATKKNLQVETPSKRNVTIIYECDPLGHSLANKELCETGQFH